MPYVEALAHPLSSKPCVSHPAGPVVETAQVPSENARCPLHRLGAQPDEPCTVGAMLPLLTTATLAPQLASIVIWPNAPTWAATAGLVLAVFVVRSIGVTLSTIEVVLLVDGYRRTSAAIGVVETLLWIWTAGFVVLHLTEPVYAIAYATAYGLGILTGSKLQQRLALGNVILRIITAVDSPSPAQPLRDAGFGVTVLNADGMAGQVRLALTVTPRKRLVEALDIIRETNPKAYVTRDAVNVSDLVPNGRTGGRRLHRR